MVQFLISDVLTAKIVLILGPLFQGHHFGVLMSLQGASLHFGGPHYRGPHFGGPYHRGPHFGGHHHRGPHFGGHHHRGPHYMGPHFRGPHFGSIHYRESSFWGSTTLYLHSSP